jgi:hypothetical protein
MGTERDRDSEMLIEMEIVRLRERARETERGRERERLGEKKTGRKMSWREKDCKRKFDFHNKMVIFLRMFICSLKI